MPQSPVLRRSVWEGQQLLRMAQLRTPAATIRLPEGEPRLLNGGVAGKVISQIQAIVERWEVLTRGGVHLMITVSLRIAIDQILSHISYPALCWTERALKQRAS